jgi:hypothetical protein
LGRVGPKGACRPPANAAACPIGCARRGYPAAGPGPRRPWSLPQERNSPGRLSQKQGLCFWHRPCRSVVGRQAAVLNSCFWVGMGAIAVFLPPGGEAQTAAGVRSSRFLPKTARRAPQALEAGAFWDHRRKSLSVRSLAVLLRKVACCFSVLG